MTAELASAAGLKQGLCVKMAVGSSVENECDAGNRQHPICHVTNGETCFALPYEDHNYGAPPPLTLSPHSAYVTNQTRTENCFQQVISTPHKMCLPATKPIESAHVEATSHQNGLFRLDGFSQKKAFYQNNAISQFDSNNAVGDVTRCICGFKHDDGYMISCDQCRVWQHIDCVNIDRNNIPDTYLCDVCNPRPLDKQKAVHIQAKKMQHLPKHADFDSSDLDTEDEKDQSSLTYTAVQSTPTSLTITSNRLTKKQEAFTNSRKRKKSKDDSKRPSKKIHINDIRKRSRSTSKSSCSESVEDDHQATFSWASKLKEWSESYQSIQENLYTTELLRAVLSSSHKPTVKKESILCQLQQQLAKVQQLRNKVMAMEDVCMSRPVIEILGSYMLSNQSEATNFGIQKRPYPYVFFYNGFDGVEVVVDCRLSGNVSRYVRRSCCPNCEVRHITEDNKIHLFIYSKENIPSGSEITIPYDFKYLNCMYNVDCGCDKFQDCPVYKFTNMRMTLEQKNSSKPFKIKDAGMGKVSPLRLSLSRIHEHTNGFSCSDNETSNNAGAEEDHLPENQRKKSREDRKMEAYIRAFERLEKKEKKKEQLHLSNSVEGKTQMATSPTNFPLNSPQAPTPQLSATANEELLSTVTPLRRANRRRSTKGNRRLSRKGRGSSYEGVLSPTLSLENDSSVSFENSNLMDPLNFNSDSLQSLPPLTIEPSTESTSKINTSPLVEQPEPNFSDTFENTTPSSETFNQSVPDEAIEMVDAPVDRCNANTDISLRNSLCKNEPNRTVSPVKEQIDAVKITPQVSETQQTKAPSQSTPIGKVEKKKVTTGAENSSAMKSEATTTVQSTSTRDLINCSFKHWDFRPGVPSGQVRIGIGRLQVGRKHYSSAHMKKTWLDMAKSESLIPENSLPASNQATSFKKRLLHNYSLEPPAHSASSSLECSSSTSQEISSSERKTTESVEVSDETHSLIFSKAVEAPSLKVQAVITQQAANDSTDVTFSNTTLQLAAEDQILPISEPHPAIEYENISEDEESTVSTGSSMDAEMLVEEVSKILPPQDYWSSTPRLNGCQIHPYSAPQHSGPPTLKLESDTESKAVPSISSVEDNQNAPTKKKVSLQEYLKRSKGSRKSSQEQQTSAPIKSTPSVTTSVSSCSSSPLRNVVVSSSPSEAATSPSVVQTSNNVICTPKTTTSPAQVKEEGENKLTETINATDLVSLASNLFGDGGEKTLTPKAISLLNEYVKRLPLTSSGLPVKTSVESGTEEVSGKTERTSKLETAVSRSSPSSSATSTPPSLSSASRPHVERSYSSPNVNNSSHSRIGRGLPAPFGNRRSASSQNSPTGLQPSSASFKKGFASPLSLSPRSSFRRRSGSCASQSPTPSSYDARRRSERSSSRDALERNGSRNDSGASNEGGCTKSSKSPKPPHAEGSSVHHTKKHSSSNQTTLDKSVHELPQKVPSLTPAVPGQPIPSLMRGPGSSRVPQVIYNRRPSPRLDGGSPRWDSPSSRDPPGRSLKDIPYSRQDPYYRSQRPASPGPYAEYDRGRNSTDRFRFDRYPPRSSRRDGDLPSPNLSNSYYHHSPHYPPSYHSDRPGYFPPRDSRPPSPGPPRHNPDYYSQSNNHRSSNYYPPDNHRR